MKLEQVRNFLFCSLLFFVAGSPPTYANNSADEKPLIRVLDEISKRYNVVFSYASKTLDKVEVQFEFKNEEQLESVVNRALSTTRLKYKYLGEKYYVIYKATKKGQRNAKKIQRKIQQIQRLESKNAITLQRSHASNTEEQIVDIFSKSGDFQNENSNIKGQITDEETGEGLIGANVVLKGTSDGTVTDYDGNFSLSLSIDPPFVLEISYTGYTTREIEITDATQFVNIALGSGALELGQVTVLGSRGKPRTQLETAVPVDVINNTTLTTSPQSELAQVMQYAAPSFHSTKQNIGHGSDHIDPMSLRGLGADQTLVLINGKRRHATSLMNVNGTVARGQVGTDLNAIPMAAVERIEVLRDGAAAQYGSDAIAGVINVILKKNVNKGEINLKSGFAATPPAAPDFITSPYDGNPDLAPVQNDGGAETFQVSANYGLGIGENGFINLTLNYLKKDPFNRMDDYTINMFSDERQGDAVAEYAVFNQNDPAAIAAYNAKWGDQFGNAIVNELNDYTGRRVSNMGGSGTTNAGIMMNMELPINQVSTFYAFGGYNYRLGQAVGFYRRPNQGARQSGLWALGFSPHLDSDIQDFSAAAGVKTLFKGWDIDLSNTYGSNTFDWTIFNSNNASQGLESGTSFQAGGLEYSQNVINLDISRGYDIGIPVNVAFGSEFRLENFVQTPGQDESWQNYGDTLSTGALKESGSQVFPGYQRGNAINKYRFNSGIYGDVEADITDAWLLGLAGRYERYSDFGDNFSWKLTSRYRVTDLITLRGAYSTGFRAPSLPQKYFSSFTLQFISLADGSVDGVNIAHLNDDSFVTRQFGIPNLKPETSTNISIGFTAKLMKRLSITIDAYQIDIKDRIGITGRFNGGQDDRFASILDPAGLSQVQFMTNAVDTETKGLDFVINYKWPLQNGSLTFIGAGNFTETRVPRDANDEPIINTGTFLEGFGTTLFNREEVSRIEVAQPTSKIVFSTLLKMDKLSAGINFTRFGEIQYIHPSDGNADSWVANAWNDGAIETRDQTFSAKILTDLDIAYQLNEALNIGLSGANIFNVYPDRHSHSANYGGGMFPYSRRVSQFGLLGAFYSAKLRFKF